MSLTKKRQKELMKQYPDGIAVGRIIIHDYLNGERRREGLPCDSTTYLENEEIDFLIRTLKTDNDRSIYNAHVKFRDAIYSLKDKVFCLENMYSCGCFNISGLIEPAVMGLKACCIQPDLFNNKEYKERCSVILLSVQTNLLPTWDAFKDVLQALYVYDFILKAIGEVFRFNFDVIRPDMDDSVKLFLAIQDEICDFTNVIVEYQIATRESKDRIIISSNFFMFLHKIIEYNYKELQISQEVQDNFLSTLEGVEITIPTVHTMINSLSNTPLHWRPKS